MVATRFAVPMAVCLPNPQPFSNSLMFAMLLFLLSHNCRLLRRRRRGNHQSPLRRLPITAERPPLAGVFEFRSGSPDRHALFQPFLSVTYTAVSATSQNSNTGKQIGRSPRWRRPLPLELLWGPASFEVPDAFFDCPESGVGVGVGGFDAVHAA